MVKTYQPSNQRNKFFPHVSAEKTFDSWAIQVFLSKSASCRGAYLANTRSLSLEGQSQGTAYIEIGRIGDPFFSATSFSWSHDRLVCAE